MEKKTTKRRAFALLIDLLVFSLLILLINYFCNTDDLNYALSTFFSHFKNKTFKHFYIFKKKTCYFFFILLFTLSLSVTAASAASKTVSFSTNNKEAGSIYWLLDMDGNYTFMEYAKCTWW